MTTDPQIGALTEGNRRASKTITWSRRRYPSPARLVFLLESDSWYLAFKALHVRG